MDGISPPREFRVSRAQDCRIDIVAPSRVDNSMQGDSSRRMRGRVSANSREHATGGTPAACPAAITPGRFTRCLSNCI
jgi:hypothetical protein